MPITPQVFRDFDIETGVGDPSTPLSAAFMTAWAARLADDVHAGLAAQVASDALAYAPMALTGTYTARPAATTVRSGTIYYATNVPEQYRSDGTTWTVVGSGGNELGYAEIVADSATNTSATPADVAGLTSTFVVGERPVVLKFSGWMRNTTASAYCWGYLTVDGTTKRKFGGVFNAFTTGDAEVRISGFTPGSTHTLKMQIAAALATGASFVPASADAPAAIQVVTV